MPFYIVNGMQVHINMGRRKAPAPCAAKVMREGKLARCMGISGYLCDGKVGDEGKSCDAPLCDAHAREIGRNRHLCPACAEKAMCHEQRSLFTHLVGTP